MTTTVLLSDDQYRTLIHSPTLSTIHCFYVASEGQIGLGLSLGFKYTIGIIHYQPHLKLGDFQITTLYFFNCKKQTEQNIEQPASALQISRVIINESLIP